MLYNPPVGGAPNDPYIDGNPGLGVEGSPVPGAAVEYAQREVVNAITAAGLAPSNADLTQLAQAIPILGGLNTLLKQRGTTVASASTVNLGAADSDYVEISGTTTITSLGSTTTRNHMWVKFQGILTLTHNGTSLLLPTAANITTAAGDTAEFVRISGGNWQCLGYMPVSGKALVSATTQLLARGTAIASASTVDLGAADSDYVEISGTTTITSLGSTTTRNHMWVKFQGALTLTHNGTSLVLPTAANIPTAAGDTAEFVRVSGGNWQCIGYTLANGKALSAVPYLQARGTAIASASTVDLGAADSDYVEISGTTTITSLGSTTTRNHMWVKFQGILTLTYNGTSLVLPTAANITTAAGDVAEFVRTSGGNWQCIDYYKANGKQLAAIAVADLPAGTSIARNISIFTTYATLATALPVDDTVPLSTEGGQIQSTSITAIVATDVFKIRAKGMVAGNAQGIAVDLIIDGVVYDVTMCSPGSVSIPDNYILMCEYAPGDTSAHTVSVRAGLNSGGNITINGSSTTRLFGGKAACSIDWEEYRA